VQEEIGMNRSRQYVFAAVLALALSAGYLAGQDKDNRAAVALQAAIKKDVVDGDLKTAIELYQKAIGESGKGPRHRRASPAAVGRVLREAGR
jgi:hypothetical protein